MDTKIQSVNFSADQKLLTFVEERLNKLTTFSTNIVSCNVFLKVDKAGAITNKITEIVLTIPGKELFSKKQCDTFEEATDSVIDALRRQLVKHKGKALA